MPPKLGSKRVLTPQEKKIAMQSLVVCAADLLMEDLDFREVVFSCIGLDPEVRTKAEYAMHLRFFKQQGSKNWHRRSTK